MNKKFFTGLREFSLILAIIALLGSAEVVAASETGNDDGLSFNLIIDDITCRGNENTDCNFILKKYYQSVGDLVDPGEIADARLRLGTLFQFRNVRVTLEKSSERGHVVVVFIVEEADQIQFNLAANYAGTDIKNYENDSFQLASGVTDFNFLGRGKQLSFNVGTSQSKSRNTQFISPTLSSSSRQKARNNYADIEYYDPHLFDSARYFFTAKISYNEWNNRHNVTLSGEQEEHLTVNDNNNSKFYFLSLGRRFGSYSYVQLSASDIDTNFNGGKIDSDTVVSMSYGRDSRDNLLFPTTGSNFTATVNHLNNSRYSSLHLAYSDHYSLTDNYVLSYRITDTFEYHEDTGSDFDLNPYYSLMFSDINQSQKHNGIYSGWQYTLHFPSNEARDRGVTFGVDYIHQTDKLIYRLAFSYEKE
ncbi:BamA/TamA family outer membrane protein [Aliikangiella coralliicola]|uniref:Uncharacterized protein n=1 Tax=Aliikangiella coralliicola TaxID=2592383 RepID=A0A545UJR1_9GAMM|nr:BamA/TamA family outer membrane protein [Aliikangiella coralliicola]TQV89673.1 hypothetical protein FLL46_01965 [Aliikangiella coralliicola]